MAHQFVAMALLAFIILGTFCVASGGHHKHIIIHVPYHVKHHHHTHTIFKHVKHIDHTPEHHFHHHDHGHEVIHDHGFHGHGHDFDLGGGWSDEHGSVADFGGGFDGGFDSGSYEHNKFGSLGWDDK